MPSCQKGVKQLDFIIGILKSADWKMERFPIFGGTHLLYLFVGLTVCVVAAYLFKNKSNRFMRIMFIAISIYFLFCEVFKQLFFYYIIGYEEYWFILLPFHLCSMPLYILPLTLFLRNGILKQSLYNFLSSYCLTGGLISVLVDGGLVSGYWIITFNSFVWHFVLVFIAMFLCVSGRVKFKLTEFAKASAVFSVCAVLALLINIALFDISKGTCDMFFIGPAPMNVVVYRDIAKIVGRPLTSLIYLATLALASFGLYAAATHLPRSKPFQS